MKKMKSSISMVFDLGFTDSTTLGRMKKEKLWHMWYQYACVPAPINTGHATVYLIDDL